MCAALWCACAFFTDSPPEGGPARTTCPETWRAHQAYHVHRLVHAFQHLLHRVSGQHHQHFHAFPRDLRMNLIKRGTLLLRRCLAENSIDVVVVKVGAEPAKDTQTDSFQWGCFHAKVGQCRRSLHSDVVFSILQMQQNSRKVGT